MREGNPMKPEGYPQTYAEVRNAEWLTGPAEEIARNLVFSRDSLLKSCERLRDTADHVERQLAKRSPIINELGELQSLGYGFDVACARYMTYQRALDALTADDE
jgi:hypothetical protein